MKLQLIRNATVKLHYGGRTLLFDPYLGEKGSGPSYAGTQHSPVVELPLSLEEILKGTEALLVSHVHSDHFDGKAREVLNRETPLFCQDEDVGLFRDMGFRHIHPIRDQVEWKNLRITRVPGQHGSGEVLEDMGLSSGFLLEAPGEPSLYWAGDTVLTDALRQWLLHHQPEVILTHSCGAVWGERVLILMDDAQTVEVCRLLPNSQVIAIHMEAVDHATVTRQQLRHTARAQSVSQEQLWIPLDGEIIKL